MVARGRCFSSSQLYRNQLIAIKHMRCFLLFLTIHRFAVRFMMSFLLGSPSRYFSVWRKFNAFDRRKSPNWEGRYLPPSPCPRQFKNISSSWISILKNKIHTKENHFKVQFTTLKSYVVIAHERIFRHNVWISYTEFLVGMLPNISFCYN